MAGAGVELFEVVFYLLFQLVLVGKDVLEPIVLLHRVVFVYLSQKHLLLHYQLLDLLALEVFIKLSFLQVPSQLLRVLSKLVLVFLYLAHQG